MNKIKFMEFMRKSKNEKTKSLIEKYQKNSDEGKAIVAEATALMTKYMIQFGDLTGLGDECSQEMDEISKLITKSVGYCARQQELSDEIFMVSIESIERVEKIEKKLDLMNDRLLAKMDRILTE